MQSYEIEIKSLLGSKENADALIERMRSMDQNLRQMESHKQLNHYFIGGDIKSLFQKVKDYVQPEKLPVFEDAVNKAKDFSVRTRQADNKIILVIKASVDDTTSSNGIARMEFETETPGLSLEQLDNILINSGFEYQAKWSRERREFKYKKLNVTVDRNAGYGYLAEFEAQTHDPSKIDELKTFIHDCMNALGAEELKQDRLERMFAFYNQNWRDYYGTEKTFNIE